MDKYHLIRKSKIIKYKCFIPRYFIFHVCKSDLIFNFLEIVLYSNRKILILICSFSVNKLFRSPRGRNILISFVGIKTNMDHAQYKHSITKEGNNYILKNKIVVVLQYIYVLHDHTKIQQNFVD